jgi:glycine cleavage system H lipoate-binding protein
MTILLVLLMFALFILGDWILRKRGEEKELQRAVASVGDGGVRLPRGVFFAPSHTWLELLPGGRACLGVDDFVARLLERPRLKLLKPAGSSVTRGEPLLAIEDGGRLLTLQSPIDARVAVVNPHLSRTGATPGNTPFCEAWACELEPAREADLKQLFLGEEARTWLAGELRRLRDLLAAEPALSPVALQDGGPPAPGAMRQASAETWSRFEREFLQVR